MLQKYIERLKLINFHVKHKSTGCPAVFAKKLGITVRAWYKWRDILINDLEVPLSYCPFKKTYYYREEGSFEMGFHKIVDKSKTNINGGFAEKISQQNPITIFHFNGIHVGNI